MRKKINNLESLRKKYNKLPRANAKNVFKETFQRWGPRLPSLKKVVYIFGGSGLKGIAYIPLVEKLPVPHAAVGKSGGVLAAYGMMAGISGERFEKTVDIREMLRRAKIRMLLKFIKGENGPNSALIERIRELCKENIEGFAGVCSLTGTIETGVFGKINGRELSDIELATLIYGSIAYPLAFMPVKAKGICTLYHPLSKKLELRKIDTLLYDGLSASLIPISESRALFGKEETLYIAFNFVNTALPKAQNIWGVLYENFENIFLHSAISALNENRDLALLLINLNARGVFNNIWIDDVEKIKEIRKWGEEMSADIKEFLT